MSKLTRLAALAALANLNVLRVSGVVSDAQTIVCALNNQTITVEFDTDGIYTAGRIVADLSGAGVKSSGVLTATANPTAAETITIGAVVYTWRASVATTANEVKIGATAEDSYNNLVAAITAGAGSGTLYGSATVAHPLATAIEGTDVAASRVLTLTENAADTNTVTIGGVVYTFQDTLTNVAGNVKIGATASDTIDNLIAAIMLGAGSGTLYAAATVVHPTVTAAVGAGDTMGATAKVAGAAGNLIGVTDTLAGSSAWASATLTGGSDKVNVSARVPGTAGDAIATTSTTSTATFGGVVLASGAEPTAEQAIDALVLAWNSGQGQFQAIKISASEVLFVDSDYGNTFASFTETMTNGAFAQAAAYRGRGAHEDVVVPIVSMVPLALEVTLGNLHAVFPFTPSSVLIMVRVTATGAIKQWGGTYVISGGRVTLTNNASTDWAATDTVTVLASP